MGRHLMRALTQDGLDEGSQSTKYTQVALKNGTSLGPSLFTQGHCRHSPGWGRGQLQMFRGPLKSLPLGCWIGVSESDLEQLGFPVDPHSA